MLRISVHATESVPQAASQHTEFTSSLQSAVPPKRSARSSAGTTATCRPPPRPRQGIDSRISTRSARGRPPPGANRRPRISAARVRDE
jgi:hypothetical protein